MTRIPSDTDVDASGEAASALHRRTMVLDGHLDIDPGFGVEGEGSDGTGQFDLAQARRGGLSGACVCLSAGLVRSTAADVASGAEAQERRFEALAGVLRRRKEEVALATSPSSFRDIVDGGRLAIVLALQNAAPFDGRIDSIERWHGRGVRMMALTFIGNNAYADSSRPYPFAGAHDNGGLSPVGRDAVRLMNELGVIVDVSQLSDAALHDVLSTTRAPVIASHSAPRGFLATRRNLADDDMRAIAGAGGVVNVVGFANYLRPTGADVQEQLRAVWTRYGLAECRTTDEAILHPDTANWKEAKFGRFLHDFHDVLDLSNPHASVDDLAAAVAYAVDLIGIDHVGLSSDFNHGGGLVGWLDAGETPNVTAALIRRGFGEEEIAKLWAGNFLRLWSDLPQGRSGDAHRSDAETIDARSPIHE